MFPHRLDPGNYYNTRYGVVHMRTDDMGMTVANMSKVKMTRKIVTSRILVYRFAQGLAEARGCRAEIQPNGGIYFYGDEQSLDTVCRIIKSTHGFHPPIALSAAVNGVLQEGYPRIEVHPQMCIDR